MNRLRSNFLMLSLSLVTGMTPPAHGAALVKQDAGSLAYVPYSDQGDVLPDFSSVGYKRGECPFPDLPVVERIAPGPGDDHVRIQEAIDRVARKEPDQHGHRGAVLLEPGDYQVEAPIRITQSGIVLRGSGRDPLTGTTLTATTKTAKSVLIEVAGVDDRTEDAASRRRITCGYVPVGARRIAVEESSLFRKGDSILVTRPGTAAWIQALGMDRIPPHPKDDRVISQWEPETYTFSWDRVVTGIEDGHVILDAPVTQAIDSRFGGGYISRYTFPGRISEVGIENLRLVSAFDETVREDQQVGHLLLKAVAVDENHAWTGISLSQASNCWVTDVTAEHFAFGCVHVGRGTKWVTVADCQNLDPVAKITGGRRYSFYLSGELALVRDCFARGGRHDFALNSRTLGPNVFLNSRGVGGYATSEPHHRYASGVLYDNVTVEGPWAWMMAINRSYAGTGHGWAGAQVVFWNCSSAIIGVQKPPTAQNFAIGYRPSDNANDSALREGAVDEMQFFSGLDEPLGGPFWGDGYRESPGQPVEPLSLYEAQLSDRRRSGNWNCPGNLPVGECAH